MLGTLGTLQKAHTCSFVAIQNTEIGKVHEETVDRKRKKSLRR